MKTMNTYANKYPRYEETPKAITAAVAFSLAMRLCGDNEVDAREMVRAEWEALYENSIIPQKPPQNTGD